MKKGIMLFGFLAQLFSGKAQKDDYSKYPVYSGNDLGVTYSKTKTVFKIWAPMAKEARMYIYNGVTDQQISSEIMRKDMNGVWVVEIHGDFKGWSYGFSVLSDDKWSDIVPDPYAKAVGVNGIRAIIVDMKETDPDDWGKDKSPVLKNATDAVIYELHIRDASIAANSGIKHKGKYRGLTEKGTTNNEGLSTGLDHLKELGVTHIHLLPFYDFYSVDVRPIRFSVYEWYINMIRTEHHGELIV